MHPAAVYCLMMTCFIVGVVIGDMHKKNER
jgi:hypothetical protein